MVIDIETYERALAILLTPAHAHREGWPRRPRKPLRSAIAVSSVWLGVIWLLALRSGAPEAVLQARVQAAFLALAAASFSIFLVRRRRLHQLRPWR